MQKLTQEEMLAGFQSEIHPPVWFVSHIMAKQTISLVALNFRTKIMRKN